MSEVKLFNKSHVYGFDRVFVCDQCDGEPLFVGSYSFFRNDATPDEIAKFCQRRGNPHLKEITDSVEVTAFQRLSHAVDRAEADCIDDEKLEKVKKMLTEIYDAASDLQSKIDDLQEFI
jgi:hypothetical protein